MQCALNSWKTVPLSKREPQPQTGLTLISAAPNHPSACWKSWLDEANIICKEQSRSCSPQSRPPSGPEMGQEITAQKKQLWWFDASTRCDPASVRRKEIQPQPKKQEAMVLKKMSPSERLNKDVKRRPLTLKASDSVKRWQSFNFSMNLQRLNYPHKCFDRKRQGHFYTGVYSVTDRLSPGGGQI